MPTTPDDRRKPPAASGAAVFDPAVLDSLAKLALVARTVVEGFMAGGHRSPIKGSSMEFAQHREYVAGDDPRFIDERIFAKSDRIMRENVDDGDLHQCAQADRAPAVIAENQEAGAIGAHLGEGESV